MVITVDIYGEIRKARQDGKSQRATAAALGISRKTVKKYWDGESVPWEHKSRNKAETVLTSETKSFIENCLETDKNEPNKKQHHTARRIYNRLVDECGFTGGESTVRAYVRELKAVPAEAYVPLVHPPANAMQIDWGEVTVKTGDVKQRVYIFCARMCYSAAPFVKVYRRQNSESFLDALVSTFEYFGGVPKRVIFDNAKVAVKDGFGASAKATDSYGALAAHYGFEPVFCNVASGNEKGLVEGLVGLARRNVFVPMLSADSIDEINIICENACIRYGNHKIQGKERTVGEMLTEERKKLYKLPVYRYDPAKRAEAVVNSCSVVRYDTNNYSVPVKYCGKRVSVKAYPEKIEIYHRGEVIAVHQRNFGRHQNVYEMEHYLPLLERKGRAIFQAKPVVDNVPEYFLDWLERQQLSPKKLVELLRISISLGYDKVMSGDTFETSQTVRIVDEITVDVPDLTMYDALCRNEEAVI